jgi:hypothetical protein
VKNNFSFFARRKQGNFHELLKQEALQISIGNKETFMNIETRGFTKNKIAVLS